MRREEDNIGRRKMGIGGSGDGWLADIREKGLSRYEMFWRQMSYYIDPTSKLDKDGGTRIV